MILDQALRIHDARFVDNAMTRKTRLSEELCPDRFIVLPGRRGVRVSDTIVDRESVAVCRMRSLALWTSRTVPERQQNGVADFYTLDITPDGLHDSGS